MVKKQLKKLQKQGLEVVKFTAVGTVAGALPASPATTHGQQFFTRASSQFGTAGLVGGTALSVKAVQELQPKKKRRRKRKRRRK